MLPVPQVLRSQPPANRPDRGDGNSRSWQVGRCDATLTPGVPPVGGPWHRSSGMKKSISLIRTKLDRISSYEDARAKARYALPRGLFDYIDGGSEGEYTMRRNVEAFEELCGARNRRSTTSGSTRPPRCSAPNSPCR